MQRGSAGFTVLEVIVAIVILGVGVVALSGSSGVVTRMIGQARRTTRAAQVAEGRLELIRQQARATTPQCSALTGGTVTDPRTRITETWQVSTAGTNRLIRVIVVYPSGRGTYTDTLATLVRCG